MKRRSFFAASFVALATLTAAPQVRADIVLANILGDNMVVQQKAPTNVWGFADAGEKVTVRFGDSEASATAGDDGRWRIKLDPPQAGGPYEMTVEGKNKITLANILVGEVWVCSGQSNMEWSVARSDNPQEEIAAAKYPQIRLFTVAKMVAAEPKESLVGDNQQGWKECSPETIPGFSAVGYFFGRKLHQDLDVPVGLVNTSWGGTIAEAWTSNETLKADDDFKPILDRAANFNPKNPNQASVLYNGMVKPIIPLTIRGAIWYQGESNAGRAQQYAKLFPAMIGDWRKNWGQGDFPFLFVQLAPFRYDRNDPRVLAEQWESQLKTLSVKNTGMAVTTDIGDVADIHPTNKQEVGRRLALWALAKTYGKELVYSGPLYKDMKVEGDKIRISFTHTGGGLTSGDGQPLSHFTIAGEDEEFVEATATIDGDTIVVHSDQVAKPAAVRFAWSDTAEPNLFNQEGLPASPFRTDDFKMVTDGAR